MKFHKLMVAASAIVVFGQASAQTSTTSTDLRGLTQNWDKVIPAEPASGACPNWSARFTCVMNNAAVRDNETGLVWTHPLGTRMEWANAKKACLNLVVGNRSAWRLPSVTELASLIDTSNPGAVKLPTKAPFVLPSPHYHDYWTSTQVPKDITRTEYDINVYILSFSNWGYGGSVYFFVDKDEIGPASYHHVWCVRGGEATGGQH